MDESSSSDEDNETLASMMSKSTRANKVGQPRRTPRDSSPDDSDSSSDNEPVLRRTTSAPNGGRFGPKSPAGKKTRAHINNFISDSSDDELLTTSVSRSTSQPKRVAVTSRKRKADGGSNGPNKRLKRAKTAPPKSPKSMRVTVKGRKVKDYPKKDMPLKPLEPDKGAPKWWEIPPYKGDIKWKSLDHNGILFPPPYKAHNVKIVYNGKPVKLSPFQEELATFYAIKLETDHVKKKAFNKNFFTEFRKALMTDDEIKHPEIKDFAKLNFRPIYDWAMAEREKEKERKKDPLYRKKLKEEKAALDEIYGYAIVDGVREKVGNYKVEPPGLFLGRGDHPKAGMLKKRLRPSQITLNIGKDHAIPPCPVPGQEWGEIIHDPSVTYIAKWVENINQSHKMVYLHASSRFKGQADMAKYDKARKLKLHINRIRSDYGKKLKNKNLATRQLATCVWIIDKLSIRVGNEKDTDEEADTVGVCSFRVEHLTKFERTPGGEHKLTLDFLGKDSMRYLNTVDIPEIIFNNLVMFVKGKKKEDMVFNQVDPTIVNEYLKTQMEGLSAKVFRTHNASVCLQDELKKTTDFQLADRKQTIDIDCMWHEKKYFYDTCNKQVAILCNHKRTVNQESFDKSSAKMDEKIEKAQEIVKTLEHRLALAEGKRKPKNKDDRSFVNKDPDALKKQLTKKRDYVTKLKMNKNLKIENKEVALGTSKINYMDPRISVAFCKRIELPIERVFNKALLDKFPWAMAAEPDYVF